MTLVLDNILVKNAIVFLLFLIFAYLSVVVENQWTVNINLIGGTALLSYLLFGYRVMASVILSIIAVHLLFEHQASIVSLEATMMIVTCTLAPAIAFYIMSAAKKNSLTNIASLNFKHVLLLSFIQAVFCSLFKLFSFSIQGLNVANRPIEMANSFSSLFVIDFIGTAVLLYIAIQIIIYFRKIKSI